MPKRTALFEEHQRLGAKMIDFGGWEMPVQYTGILDEHTACRESAGLFDVSHMGEVIVEGPGAEAFLNYLVTNNVAKTVPGQAQYTVMCHENGGAVDDLVIYRQSADRFFVVVNAANTDKDFEHMKKVLEKFRAGGGAEVKLSNESAAYSQIAIQGRKAQEILQPLADVDLDAIKYFRFAEGNLLGGIPALIARTGYTGEDGFELYVPWNDGPRVWSALIEAGTPAGLRPCGLAARDTLRLEFKLALYGHELTDETNPLEAKLGWVVKFDKADFVGRKALEEIKSKGPSRQLVGLKLLDRGIPRQGYEVYTEDGSKRIGVLTSGTHSPSLKEAIGIAYIDVPHHEVGSRVSVDVRGRKIPAEVVKTPFYDRPY